MKWYLLARRSHWTVVSSSILSLLAVLTVGLPFPVPQVLSGHLVPVGAHLLLAAFYPVLVATGWGGPALRMELGSCRIGPLYDALAVGILVTPVLGAVGVGLVRGESGFAWAWLRDTTFLATVTLLALAFLPRHLAAVGPVGLVLVMALFGGTATGHASWACLRAPGTVLGALVGCGILTVAVALYRPVSAWALGKGMRSLDG